MPYSTKSRLGLVKDILHVQWHTVENTQTFAPRNYTGSKGLNINIMFLIIKFKYVGLPDFIGCVDVIQHQPFQHFWSTFTTPELKIK